MQIKSEKLLIAPKDMENAGLISSKIKKMLVGLGIDRTIIKRVSIASYEAEINVVIHSFGGYCVYEIDDDNIFTISYIDIGPGIEDIEKAMQKGWSTASRFEHELGFGAGMGFSNMKEAADKLEVTSSPSGTTVKLYFKIK